MAAYRKRLAQISITIPPSPPVMVGADMAIAGGAGQIR
jgi:hypothetical protein